MSVGYEDRVYRPVAHPERIRTLQRLARFGYVIKGGIYVLIGALALLAAFGEREGQLGGPKDAVQRMAAQPLGDVLCVLTGVGLLAYALWRALETVLDVREHGNDSKGLTKRAVHGASALMNGAVGVFVLDIVLGSSGGDATAPTTFVGRLMETSTGAIVVGLIGLGFLLFGLAQIGTGWSAKFALRLNTPRMNERERVWAVRAGRFGHIARGVVFSIVGIFLIQAALRRDPSEARGLGGALHEIASQPFGQALLAIVALGLVAYGAYQVVFAKYGRLIGR